MTTKEKVQEKSKEGKDERIEEGKEETERTKKKNPTLTNRECGTRHEKITGSQDDNPRNYPVWIEMRTVVRGVLDLSCGENADWMYGTHLFAI